LTSVRALAEILHSDTNIDPERHNKFTGIIISESERLSRLINDVLDFQKMESGQIQWKISQFDFKEIIEQSLASTFQLVEEKNIDMQFSLPKSQIRVAGDMDRLIQVMVNLISNAVKFCNPENGTIKIGMDTEDTLLKVYVEDNGVGISSENLEIVFEEFRQIHDNSRGRPHGSGVGLTICRHIVDFHKGSIWVESEVGKGATFLFTIPLAKYSDLDEGVKIT